MNKYLALALTNVSVFVIVVAGSQFCFNLFMNGRIDIESLWMTILAVGGFLIGFEGIFKKGYL